MPRTGDSAERKRNVLMTHAQARRFLDARFVELREGLIAQFDAEVFPTELAVSLEVLNRKWGVAIQKLRGLILPQGPRTHRTRPVHTVNPKLCGKEKPLPSHSLIQRRAKQKKLAARRSAAVSQGSRRNQGGRTLGRKGRSHHPFNARTGSGYVKTQAGPGRPRQTDAHKKKKEAARNRLKERYRKEKVWKRRHDARQVIYRDRRTAAAEKRIAALKAQHTAKLKAARAKWARDNLSPAERERFKDDRPNHRTDLAYLPVGANRQRAVSRAGKKVRKHFHRTKRNLFQRAAIFALLVARRIRVNKTRAKHLRGYWAKVKEDARR